MLDCIKRLFAASRGADATAGTGIEQWAQAAQARVRARARHEGFVDRRRARQRDLAPRVGPVAAPLHRRPGTARARRAGPARDLQVLVINRAAEGSVGERRSSTQFTERRADAHRHADPARDALAGDVPQARRQRAARRWAAASARVASVKPWLLRWLRARCRRRCSMRRAPGRRPTPFVLMIGARPPELRARRCAEPRPARRRRWLARVRDRDRRGAARGRRMARLGAAGARRRGTSAVAARRGTARS